jgi:hypothetical protein
MEVQGMEIRTYTPAAIGSTTLIASPAAVAAPVAPNPAALSNDVFEVPQPIQIGASPASATTADTIVEPQPVYKNPLLAAGLFNPASLTPSNGDVSVLPWDGPNSAIDPASAPSVKAELKKLHSAAEGVESVMLKDLVAKMRASSGKGLFGDNMESKIHDDMMNEAIADKMASAGGIGIAKALYNSMQNVVMRRAAAAEYAKTTNVGG